MTLEINAVSEALERIVAEKGEDYVYPLAGDDCVYAEKTSDGYVPSCIVGHVVAALDAEAFKNAAEYEQVNGESGGVSDFFQYGFYYGDDRNDWGEYPEESEEYQPGIIHDEVLTSALQIAQTTQDYGFTWGEALENYRAVLADPSRFMEIDADLRERKYKRDRKP